MSTALRAPAPVAVHCWPIPLQETLKQNSGSVSVGSLGPGVHKVCLSTLSVSGRYGVHQKATKIKCWRVCAGKGTLLHSWWGCKLVQSLWRTIWRFLKKLKIEFPIWVKGSLSVFPNILRFLGLPKEHLFQWTVMHGTFSFSTFISNKDNF